jgi:hypothetical protein
VLENLTTFRSRAAAAPRARHATQLGYILTPSYSTLRIAKTRWTNIARSSKASCPQLRWLEKPSRCRKCLNFLENPPLDTPNGGSRIRRARSYDCRSRGVGTRYFGTPSPNTTVFGILRPPISALRGSSVLPYITLMVQYGIITGIYTADICKNGRFICFYCAYYGESPYKSTTIRFFKIIWGLPAGNEDPKI